MRILAVLLFISLSVVTSGKAFAQQITRTLIEGNGAIVELPRAASSIFVGDPSVADVRVVSGMSLFLAGIAPGTTNVFALDFEDQLIRSFRIRVVGNDEEARGTLRSGIRNSDVRIDANESAAIMRGQANSLQDALAALDARRSLEADGRLVVDRTTLHGGAQVSLKVRFVEASRSDMRELGFDLSAIGQIGGNPLTVLTGRSLSSNANGGLLASIDTGNVDAVLTALDEQGVVEILSEPTLTTTSGTKASFRAGGEFGFPVNQGDGVVGIEYREFGVSLDFLPTILPSNRIALEVAPEVSFIDPSLTSNVSGSAPPGLSVRRAETTVEVGSGQTFAIAGLYEQFTSDVDAGVPGLRRAPVIGRLFSRETRLNRERELVIFITPYLAEASDVSAQNRRPAPSIADTVGFIIK